ncbi:uncharacterized protein LOC122574172 [Bombus pyrosoma]|uniref:uncharacterized protein LOC122574172 n=1 Tax=Bombus pyrosoma TaxID=396416 RepID=UPI001CB90A76|nr:uncharacterized protein LOC122574172 [Bombus pyrosoma]
MNNKKDSKAETSLPSASGTQNKTESLDSSTRAISDIVQRQNEEFRQQFNEIKNALRLTNEENRKRANEIEILGRNLSRVKPSQIDIESTEFGSMMTNDDDNTSVLKHDTNPPPPMPQRPPKYVQPSNRTTANSGNLKAESALKCIAILNGENDIGIEDFIREIKEIRMMCSEQALLLKMIKIEKIVEVAMAIRSVHINEFETLYEALRRNVATQVSVRGHQDQLREIRQGLTENVQNYNIRFRRAFNKLRSIITNKYKDELTPRAMNNRLYMDSVTDYVRDLRSEI